jgi:hypothetical protein
MLSPRPRSRARAMLHSHAVLFALNTWGAIREVYSAQGEPDPILSMAGDVAFDAVTVSSLKPPSPPLVLSRTLLAIQPPSSSQHFTGLTSDL